MCKTIVSIVSRSVCIGNGKTLRRSDELEVELVLFRCPGNAFMLRRVFPDHLIKQLGIKSTLPIRESICVEKGGIIPLIIPCAKHPLEILPLGDCCNFFFRFLFRTLSDVYT